MNEELRDQLRRLDPMHPGVPTEPPSPELLEGIMNEDITNDSPTAPNRRGRNRWYAVAGVAAVALGLAIAIPALDTGTTTTTQAAIAPLELSLGEGGDAMASCMVFDVAILADMPVAFEGTVTAVAGEQVTMTVVRWFTGGDATTVELTAPAGMVGLTGGIEFTEGGQYLVTATDGTVNYCGYTGPSTPELVLAFEQAFPQ